MIKMIVACDINGSIGFNNDLLFHIKEDMKFFRETTENHKVVMGFNTWESLPVRPLPNREHFILTSKDNVEESDNVHVIRTIEDIVELGKNEDIFIIGGGKLYNEMISRNLIDEAYVTLVVHQFKHADTYIPMYKVMGNLRTRELLTTFKFEHPTYVYKFTR